MKKILPILVLLAMVASAVPLAMATDPAYPAVNPPEPGCAWEDNDTQCGINTFVKLTGGTGGGEGGSNTPPFIKCKWEWDDEFEKPVAECPHDCIDCPEGCPDFDVDATADGVMRHDACPCVDGLQVAVDLESQVKVGVAAVVADAQGYEDIQHVYADIWHPDGQFKFQIELTPIPYVDKEQSLAMFNHFFECHEDLIKWDPLYDYADVIDQLNEPLALLYVGHFYLDYCQPGGYYTVAIRAHDTMNAWSDYLYNYFWYIPTTAVRLDFTSINYGDVSVCVNKWIGGDGVMSMGDQKPTAKNIGNTPVDLYVWQDDMDFGQTDSSWNVEFDARLTADGNIVTYDPYKDAAGHKGVRIPGYIKLCTQEKLDFSIHVKKGESGYQYSGKMCISAYRHGNPIWKTPGQFIGNAPGSIAQDIYPGIDPD
jgi:hypothetical protein